VQSNRPGTMFLERLWQALPNERDKLRPYIERAKFYRNECGCIMGGTFFVGALAPLICDVLFLHQIGGGGWFGTALRGAAFVFGVSMLGKVIGIGIARMRLALTYRELRIRYRLDGN